MASQRKQTQNIDGWYITLQLAICQTGRYFRHVTVYCFYDVIRTDVHQHRFGQNEFLGVVNDVITAAVSVKDARVSVPAVILARLKVEAEKLTGDPLRTFKKVSEDDNPLLYRQDLKYQDVIRGKQPAGDITSLGPSEAGRGKMVGSEQIKTIGAPNQPIRAPNQA